MLFCSLCQAFSFAYVNTCAVCMHTYILTSMPVSACVCLCANQQVVAGSSWGILDLSPVITVIHQLLGSVSVEGKIISALKDINLFHL